MQSYRNDIQGLRAISVLAVLLFHLDPELVPGGFIGVDIFFVISGYLITGILWRDLSSGSFSFAAFYARRIKRLFPALFATLLACLVAAWLIVYPGELLLFAKSMIATVLYLSNIFFLSQSDYFASDVELSPLLHTWSLSVEEQFYLVFPLLLWLIFNKSPRRVLWVLGATALASFVLSEIMVRLAPSAAFYLSPTRFFQFLAGSLVVMLPFNNRSKKAVMEALSWLGIGLILLCFFMFSGTSSFPGHNALVPTLAAALTLFAGQHQGLASSRILSHPIPTVVGKISYSLYLWHWPIIVFYKIAVRPEADLHKYEQLGLLVASMAAGYLSWRYIENPILTLDTRGRNAKVLRLGFSSSLVVLMIGALILLLDGSPERFSRDQLKYIEYLDYPRQGERQGSCFLVKGYTDLKLYDEQQCLLVNNERPNILLVGDSHSAHFFSPLQRSLPDYNISQANASGCKPIIDYSDSGHYCVALMQKTFETTIKTHDFDAIILSAYWKHQDLQQLEKTAEYLAQYTARVIVLGPIITYDQALPRLLARFSNDGEETAAFRAARNLDEITELDSQMKKLIVGKNIEYISILDIICPGDKCTTLTSKGNPIQWDYGHLTLEGGIELVNSLISRGVF